MTAPASAPSGNGSGASNLRQRMISAVVLIVVVLALTWAGGIWYRLFCAAIAAAVFYEWISMTTPARPHSMVLAILLAIILVLMIAGYPATFLLAALGAAVLIGGAYAAFGRLGYWPVVGVLYAGLAGISLALVRGSDVSGLLATLFLFAIVWATDIMAFFAGRAVGGPKLAPSISPGKTWSGAIGGAVSGLAGGIAVAYFGSALSGLVVMAAVALILSIVSQLGDLFESFLKRRFAVKDSSHLIPGHGGVMDRVDGLVAAALALLVLGASQVGPDLPAHAFFAN